MPNITPFLWFDSTAEQAADFYLSIFPGRKISELRNDGTTVGSAGTILVLEIELLGQRITFLNGGPAHKLTEAFSFTVDCDSQQEIDDYWAKLTADGGKESVCGWLTDKFGVSWQINPRNIRELIRKPAAMKAMMAMIKIDQAALEEAADQS